MKKLDSPCLQLGESPLWRKESQEFLLTDILGKTLYTWEPGQEEVDLFLPCNHEIGAFLLDTKGDLILCTAAGVFHCPYGGGPQNFRLIFQVDMEPGERFNDAICDAKGRILAGTKRQNNQNGKLWMLEAGKEPKVLLTGLEISNGMGFSLDGNIFYHTDSVKHTVYQYEYDVEKGEISGGVPLITIENAEPDGLTVDRDGNLWTACWYLGQIRQYSPEGILLQTIQTPASQTSNMKFGGEDLTTCLITSGAVASQNPNDGYCYTMDATCGGVEEHRVVTP